MSRIGKQPVPLPQGVRIHTADAVVRVEGPTGTLQPGRDPEGRVEGRGGGVVAKVDRQGVVTLEGPDRELLGHTVAAIRELRPPEPYKGKGVKYAEETIRRKAGKAGKAAAGGTR